MIASQSSDQVLSLFNDGSGEITGWGTNYTGMGVPGADPSAIAVGSLNPNSPNPGNAAEPDILIANQGVDQVWPAYGRTDGQAFDFGGVEMTGADPVAIAMGTPPTSAVPAATSNPRCATLRKKLRRAKKAHNRARVRKLRRKLRRLGC